MTRAINPRRGARRVVGAAAATSLVLALLGGASASAETVTRHGSLGLTPGWTSATFDRDALVLPFSVTAPCATTDYGSGITSTNCDSVRVELVHPSNPVAIDTSIVFPKDDGTASGSLSLYGFMLKGYGAHTLRATDTDTGETVTATIVLKALTRTSGTVGRTKKAPASATLRVAATLTAFAGWSWTAPPGSYALTLQRKSGSSWVGVRTINTTTGTASWSVKVTKQATYRVCHPADAQSTASCTSARTL